MSVFLYILLGVILGAGAVLALMKKRVGEIEAELVRTEKERDEQADFVSGIDEFNRKMQEMKKERKQKIIDKLAGVKNIKTNETADMLEISRATAFRYLEELEKEGKIEQVGAYGRNVEYTLK